jgi:hypothetical protein
MSHEYRILGAVSKRYLSDPRKRNWLEKGFLLRRKEGIPLVIQLTN